MTTFLKHGDSPGKKNAVSVKKLRTFSDLRLANGCKYILEKKLPADISCVRTYGPGGAEIDAGSGRAKEKGPAPDSWLSFPRIRTLEKLPANLASVEEIGRNGDTKKIRARGLTVHATET
jgi:hypothetical protein